jgi:glycosyltransferase involved in cell wall biosynthesis
MDNILPGVSLVICCHNSSLRLPKTIEHLNAQTVSADIPWEVIVVDNASTDDTANVAEKCLNVCLKLRGRVVSEARIGLTNARNRGFEEAKYEFVSFIDDDNWVSSNWVQIVYEVMTKHPEVAVCGGYSQAVCEIIPPQWFETYKESYAVGPEEIEAGDITWTRGNVWGAGMTIRKFAWEALMEQGFQSQLSDRSGRNLISGGDSEICFAVKAAGWRIWYEPRLRLQHYLPADRLTWKYLMRLHRAFGASSVGIDPYYFVLDGDKNAVKALIKSTWQGRVLLSVITLLRHFTKVLFLSESVSEGNPDILSIERQLGRLTELISKRSAYRKRVMNLKCAQWINKTIVQNK